MQKIVDTIEGIDVIGKAERMIPQDTDEKGNLIVHDDISTNDTPEEAAKKRKERLRDTKTGWFSPFIDETYDPYTNPEAAFSFTDIFAGFPVYSEDDIPSDAEWYEYLYYYKYLINIIGIALPWTLFVLCLFGYNLYFNIKLNRLWAGGSIWLICETLFLMWQGMVSIITVFEIPIFVRAFRVMRWVDVLVSIFSCVPYGILFFEWLMQLFIYDRSEYQVADLGWNMFLGYNVILHWPVLPINVVIVIKEISMEWFVFMQDGVSQKAVPLRETETDIFWLILFYGNPITYLDYLWQLIAGKDMTEYFPPE